MLSKLLPICMLLQFPFVEKGWLHFIRHAICIEGRGIDIIYRRFWDVLTLYQDTYLHGYMV
jgi:hypothetical protein